MRVLFHISTISTYFMFAGISLLNETLVAIKFEPRKSDAPQLRDEYRTYKLMAGSGKFFKVFAFRFKLLKWACQMFITLGKKVCIIFL